MCIHPDNIPMLAEVGDHFLEAGHKVTIFGDVDIIFAVERIVL